jgi:hypothetical protein
MMLMCNRFLRGRRLRRQPRCNNAGGEITPTATVAPSASTAAIPNGSTERTSTSAN